MIINAILQDKIACHNCKIINYQQQDNQLLSFSLRKQDNQKFIKKIRLKKIIKEKLNKKRDYRPTIRSTQFVLIRSKRQLIKKDNQLHSENRTRVIIKEYISSSTHPNIIKQRNQLSMNNTQQQSCFSLLDLSPVPQNSYPFQSSCNPSKVNNFFINDRPSSLYQLPSTNNIGSAILDGRTEDPKKDLQYQNYNKPTTFGHYHNFHNDIGNNHQNLFSYNNPETQEFYSHDQEMNNINHRMDSVNLLEKKDHINSNIVNKGFYVENDVNVKQNLISTPVPEENLFGNVQICQDMNTYTQTLTPVSQKNQFSQNSLQSNIPTPNIGQVIQNTSDKFQQQNVINQTLFQPYNNQLSSTIQNASLYPLQVNTQMNGSNNIKNPQNNGYPSCQRQDSFGSVNNSFQSMHISANHNSQQTEGKKDYYEKVKQAMSMNSKIKENNNKNMNSINNSVHSNNSINNNTNNNTLNMNFINNMSTSSYSQQLTMQHSTNSMNSQTSIDSTSSINESQIQIHTNNNHTNNKSIYSQNVNVNSQNGHIISASVPVPSSHQFQGNNYNILKINNLPFSMTTSVNNVIEEEQEQDYRLESQKDRFLPPSKEESDNEDEEQENDNKNNSKELQEFARKVDFCKCKKSKCLKLYCECFLRGNFCNDQCICTECGNHADNSDERGKAIDEAKTRNQDAFNLKFQKSQNQVTHKKGCHCKKTHCLKKYCECYNAGLKCTINCKCEECKNTVDNLKSQGGLGGTQSTAIMNFDNECNSQELNSNSQMIQSIDPQMNNIRERNVSMCSSTGVSGFHNKKRTRSEVFDQIQFKNDYLLQQPQNNDAFEPEVRKKKNSLMLKLPNVSKQKSIQQQNQTSYNSFDQNFVFTSHPQIKNNMTASQPIHTQSKNIQS